MFILQLADNPNQHLRNMAFDALDQSICAVLGSERFQDYVPSRHHGMSDDVSNFSTLLMDGKCSLLTLVAYASCCVTVYRW